MRWLSTGWCRSRWRSWSNRKRWSLRQPGFGRVLVGGSDRAATGVPRSELCGQRADAGAFTKDGGTACDPYLRQAWRCYAGGCRDLCAGERASLKGRTDKGCAMNAHPTGCDRNWTSGRSELFLPVAQGHGPRPPRPKGGRALRTRCWRTAKA